MQCQRGGQSADAGTGDQDVSHVVSFPLYPGSAPTFYKSNIDMRQ
jgi:hypothetical protein